MNYPVKPRVPGWVHSDDKYWWARIRFVETELSGPLQSTHLAMGIKAVTYGVCQCLHAFYEMLEWFNSDSSTFYTPIGELDMVLHEMYAVFRLPWGEVPNMECYLPHKELTALKKDHPVMYDMNWELLFHFHICLDSQNEKKRSKGISYISWATYHFPTIKGPDPAKCLSPQAKKEIE